MSDQSLRWTIFVGLLILTITLVLLGLPLFAFFGCVFVGGALLNVLHHESEPSNLSRK